MRLSDFIVENLEPILQAWEDFARTVATPMPALDQRGLRNHGEYILRAVAAEMRTPQNEQQQIDKSHGLGPVSVDETAAQSHAITRLMAGFSLDQMVSEYRALRSSVLRLWLPNRDFGSDHHVEDIIRFNEGIDQALAESIGTYGKAVEVTRKTVLGVLGHDLRSPLGAVMMGADLLQRSDSLQGKEKLVAAQIGTSVRRANHMVNDLLDLARCNLGTGIAIKKEQAIDLRQVCKAMVAEVSAAHPEATIVLADQQVQPGSYDAARMAQVFTNLMVNAVRHGDPKLPIEVALYQEAGNLVFSVHNQGEPISPEAIPYLFNPEGRYSRYANGEQGAGAGLGLGLFIAFEIVTAHGGHLDVESSEGSGTRFWMTVPAA